MTESSDSSMNSGTELYYESGSFSCTCWEASQYPLAMVLSVRPPILSC